MNSTPEIPWESWFGMSVGFGVLLLMAAAYLGLVIWSVIWAAKDATSRGKEGILIGVLVFFTWPLGLLVWIVARPEYRIAPPPIPRPPPVPRS